MSKKISALSAVAIPATDDVFAGVQDGINYKWSIAQILRAPVDVQNVKHYGATGDGTTDDTAALQAALDAGGLVFIPEGTYYCPDGATVSKNNTWVLGEGRGSILKSDGTGNINCLTATSKSGLIFSELAFDNDVSGVGYGVQIIACDGVIFNKLYAATPKSAIVGTRWDDPTYSTNVLIDGLESNNSQDAGVYCFRTRYLTVVNCHFYESKASHEISIQRCDHFVVANNVVHSTSGDSYGITLSDSCDKFVIANNVTRGCAAGIKSLAAFPISTNGVVAGNLVSESTLFGIDLHSWDDVSIVNNFVITVSGGSALDGMRVIECDRLIISNNKVLSPSRHGIKLQTVVDSNVVDNYVKDCADEKAGIHISDTCTGNEISRNRVYTSAAETYQDYGIQIANANCSNNRFINNWLNANPTPFAAGGATNIVRNNSGYTTENSGTATILNENTSIAVAHGLAVTPTVDDISVVLAENPTNDPGNIWVDTIGAANFTINCRNDPGASNLDLAWQAIVL